MLYNNLVVILFLFRVEVEIFGESILVVILFLFRVDLGIFGEKWCLVF